MTPPESVFALIRRGEARASVLKLRTKPSEGHGNVLTYQSPTTILHLLFEENGRLAEASLGRFVPSRSGFVEPVFAEKWRPAAQLRFTPAAVYWGVERGESKNDVLTRFPNPRNRFPRGLDYAVRGTVGMILFDRADRVVLADLGPSPNPKLYYEDYSSQSRWPPPEPSVLRGEP